jgi:hypothetical protein
MSLGRKPLCFDRYRSYAEYLRHPVFRAARAVAMRRAGSRCEECDAPATEVHHHRIQGVADEQPGAPDYPAFGTFDSPANLKPVCHACHCRLEGKAS